MRFFPLILRRPDNLLSVPAVADRFPTQRPGFLQGDPALWVPSTLASLERQTQQPVLPWSPQCDLLMLPSPALASELPLEVLDGLPADYPVLLYEAQQPLFPNVLVGDGNQSQSVDFKTASSGLRAYRSAFRHLGIGETEALVLLPASRVRYLARLAFRFESKPSPGPSLQNRRFLTLALDYHRSVAALSAQSSQNQSHNASSATMFTPRQLQPASRVAVVVPHFDDECLAFGGAIATAVAAGSEVRLIWLTDGSRGVSTVSHEESAKIRHQEAMRAAEILGVSDVHFLEAPETKLTTRGPWASQLTQLLDEFQPTRIHSLWWAENNVDHYESNRLLRSAMPPSLSCCEMAVGGVWSPLPLLAGVTQSLALTAETVAIQKRALAAHASQIKEVDYSRVSAGLQAWNGRFSNGPAENYLVMPAHQYWQAFVQSGASKRWLLA